MKEIKDYIHLYKGCLTKVVHPDNELPILRKLSDMTEEELKESNLKTHPKFWMTESNIWCFTAEITRYLLLKHFDLFGLIQAGLAIDKTKIEQL